MLPRRMVCLGLALSLAAWLSFRGLPATAQDRAVPATGDLLLRALPPNVDLMVHTNDLPALLRSASDAGFGPAAAWRAAFREQCAAWCEEAEGGEDLAKAAVGLLSAADGEVLAAALPLPIAGRGRRFSILALRSSKDAAELRRHVDGLLEYGLRSRYPGDLTDERIGDRPVRSLAGVHRRLYVLVEDGLVVVSDHALPLGLFLRGLEQAASAGAPASGGVARFDVRYGPRAGRWNGWLFGKGESSSWASAAAADAQDAPLVLLDGEGASARAVSAVASLAVGDVPLLPVPPPAWMLRERPELAKAATGAALLVTRTDGDVTLGAAGALDGAAAKGLAEALGVPVHPAEGGFVVNGPAAALHAGRSMPGYAARLGWLRGFADGNLPLPLSGMDRVHLAPVWKAVQGTASDGATGVDGILPWKAGDRAGELRGPAWHGPATMLLLRTLHHLGRGLPPGATSDPASAPTPDRRPAGAPLPTPGEGAAGDK